MPEAIQAQRVAVCGGGYTGQAITRALRRLGKTVVVTDSRPAAELTAAAQILADLGAEFHAGAHDPAVIGACDLVVTSPGVSWREPALEAARARGVRVWGELEFAARLTAAKLVGITGTKGKTTTSALTALMLDAPLANAEAYSSKGTPLTELVSNSPEMPLVVTEMSSYQLDRIDALRPWVGALLNIGEDHIEEHGSLAAYAAAKANLFRNQAGDDRAVYNHDDPRVRPIGEALTVRRLPFSRRESLAAGVWSDEAGIVTQLPAALGGLSGRLLRWDQVSPALRLQRPSLLAACAIALAAGADPAAIGAVAGQFAGLPHRMEIVRNWHDLTFVNDSKGTNPLATENAIRQSPAPVVLIAGGLTKGVDLSVLREPFGLLRGLVLIGQDAPLLRAVAEQAAVSQVRAAATLESAVEAALELATPGDWVVLSPCGASFDMFRDFADRGDQFKAIVQQLPA
ncbi:MAG: UDP-N-acetylmuramoyl-L-alanine--D-glutamate ligase [Fimbriimonadaceae bacterium]|nr:UDP-N-acetylmuramoyl-L-alanine--D-glutamate ligase [Fimbriimonadaceae bacterium]